MGEDDVAECNRLRDEVSLLPRLTFYVRDTLPVRGGVMYGSPVISNPGCLELPVISNLRPDQVPSICFSQEPMSSCFSLTLLFYPGYLELWGSRKAGKPC